MGKIDLEKSKKLSAILAGKAKPPKRASLEEKRRDVLYDLVLNRLEKQINECLELIKIGS